MLLQMFSKLKPAHLNTTVNTFSATVHAEMSTDCQDQLRVIHMLKLSEQSDIEVKNFFHVETQSNIHPY